MVLFHMWHSTKVYPTCNHWKVKLQQESHSGIPGINGIKDEGMSHAYSQKIQGDDGVLLVGGFNPLEKYVCQNGNLPQIEVKIKNI